MILSLAAAVAVVRAPPGVKERAPPAWRALQLAELPSELASGARGKLHGAPPCLRSLRKVGWGHTARWRLGAYSDGELACDVDFARLCAEERFKKFVAGHDWGVKNEGEGLEDEVGEIREQFLQRRARTTRRARARPPPFFRSGLTDAAAGTRC